MLLYCFMYITEKAVCCHYLIVSKKKDMIEKLTLKNWKSYGDAFLYVEPLTIIIGFNASGKSNVLDALSFLSDLAKGMSVGDATKKIRGGEEWILRNGTSTTTLGIDVYDDEKECTYSYEIEIGRNDAVFEIRSERLVKQSKKNSLVLLDTAEGNGSDNTRLSLTSYTGNKDKRRELNVFREIMSLQQLVSLDIQKDVRDGVLCVIEHLKNIFVLNPIPSLMRNYVPVQKELKEDASNIAGVIAGIGEEARGALLKRIGGLVRNLPERDIEEIWTDTVGMFGRDAMLYCKEKWTDSTELTLDARGMSDGTLRFVAIVTALLTLPERTLLLIEEVDNGLHPSRSEELVRALKSLGAERNIDVLCTTHNPYLVDALGTELIPCISYVKRDKDSGASVICTMDENEDLFNLMASGSIGMSMAKGKI